MQKVCSSNILEIACFHIESCIEAQQAGADRIEFCKDYSLGGITPSHDDILKARQALHIPLHIIIRPRGGNFIYTKDEVETMKRDIIFCKENGINGVVFGALTTDHKFDSFINKEFLEVAGSMSATFHRAIDECADIDDAMVNLIKAGFTRVLTSGGKQNALDGIQNINRLQQKFGKQIIIIPGGGIRSSNISRLLEQTECFEFHSAALTSTKELVDTTEIKQLLQKIKLT